MNRSTVILNLVHSACLLACASVLGAEFRVADFGAHGDGTGDNTKAIQQAIDAAAAAGGGKVTFTPGTYRSGALFLKSNVQLDLAAGVVIQAIQDDLLYPERPTRVAGIEMVWPAALLNVYQQTNVTISGKGKIDGNGEYWWHKFWGRDGKGGMLKDYKARGLRWAVDYDCKRVRALAVYDSGDVEIRDVTIERSGFWSLTLTYSHDVKVDGVTIRANINGIGPSSDGIDIDSSRNVLVQNCDIDCNDDNICLKAGRDWDGLRVNRPTENITIRDCITRAGHGMLTLGSETSGGIRNVRVNGLKAFGTSNGIRFKSARVRGGVVENIVFSDISMEDVENPFHFELNWYPSYSYPTIPPGVDTNLMPPHWSVLTHRVEPPERGIPEFRNIVISNVTATGAAQGIYANAYPEKPMRDVRFENVRIAAEKPGQISNAKDWTMKNVVLTTPNNGEIRLLHSQSVQLPSMVNGASAETVTPKHSLPSPLKLGLANSNEANSEAPLRFQFGKTRSPAHASEQEGVSLVQTNDIFSLERTYGFEPGALVAPGDGCMTSSGPFCFSVALPEGNCAVKLTFGDQNSATTNTVKAELRRLMLESVITRPGEFITRDITVNLRTPAIPENGDVKLKQREKEEAMVSWDKKLTLEFNGSRPGLAALEIKPTSVPTVFLLGDSTVCDQALEPWNSWGQMITRFFQPGIVVANYAESGESIKSSLSAKRVDKVFAEMKPGDWLLVQFGHNDMKDKATNALAIYKTNLQMIVSRTREKGATPVLLTSMERKVGVQKDTLAGYPDTVRAVAREENVALIDLHAMSKVLYRAMGGELDQAFEDGTHHNAYGSYELARCVALGIHQSHLPLASYLVAGTDEFDPQHPDAAAAFSVPPSPQQSFAKPDGD